MSVTTIFSHAGVELRHGDCLDGAPAMPPGGVDLVFADLPYGQTQNAWDKIIAPEKLWPALRRVCKPNAAMVFTAIQPFASLMVMSNLRSFRYEDIWRKNKSTGFLNSKRRPLRVHENVLTFFDRTPLYQPQMSEGHEPGHAVNGRLSKSSVYGETPTPRRWGGSTQRYPVSVVDIPVVNSADPERIHPNQKPVALASLYIRTHTRPGELVLDPAAGGGSTLIAAMRLGRRAIGFELDLAMAEKAAAVLERAAVCSKAG